MLKILYMNPVGSDVFDKSVLETIEMVKRPDVKARVVHLSKGPVHMEYPYYEHLNLGQTLKWVKWTEKEG